MATYPIDEFISTGLEDEMEIVSSSKIILGHFHNEYDTIGLQEQFDGSFPWFECRTEDVSSLARDAQVVILSGYYKVKDIHPNGTGLSVVILYKT